jgi:GNAT superfamily N-acetyltransferase
MSLVPTDNPESADYRIRDLDPVSDAEIEWVARGMRQTLIEVEGEETGTALYAMDWLRERVRWHLDPAQSTAAIFVAVDREGQIVGHSIVRCETEADGRPYGLFSTTYVEPGSRRSAVASSLLQHGEHWMRQRGLPEAATWTSASNTKLHNLYAKHGYAVTARHTHEQTQTPMVKLAKRFTG